MSYLEQQGPKLNWRRRVVDSLLQILALPYTGSLHHYTINPMAQIEDGQNQRPEEVLASLKKFKKMKGDEMKFTQQAVRQTLLSL